MRYQVKTNDSPTIIARTYGVPFDALISANSHKPTKMVNGRRTWQGLLPRETIIVPVGGMVGDSVSDAVNALVAAGGPCLSSNVRLTCAAQAALGFTPGHGVDGKWGNDASAAAKAHGFNVPACSPRPAWWTPPGQSNCGAIAAPAASPIPAPMAASSLSSVAAVALGALSSDPNYCTSVGRVGSAVNSAVHNFKAAWNAANPSKPVPIGTGKYEPVVADALSAALSGRPVPPGCGAAAATPTASSQPGPTSVPTQTPPSGGAAVTPAAAAASSAPTAVLALLSFNPCDQANAPLVGQAQAALGLKPGAGLDGKYGDDTAALARKVLPNAPAGCSPRPAWWAPKGSTNIGGAGSTTPAAKAADATQVAQTAADTAKTTTDPDQAAAAAATAAQAAAAAKAAADTAAASQKAAADQAAATAAQAAEAANAAAQKAAGNAITGPEKKEGLSTGAMVAGALGAAALVGLIAVAASGKKKTHGRRASGHGTHRKPAHHKRKTTHKKKSSHGKKRH
jgi:hypothetical protein